LIHFYKRMLCLVFCLIVVVGATATDSEENDLRRQFVHSELVAAEDIKVTSNEFVHLAMIVANVKKGDLVARIIKVLQDLLNSLFFSSMGTPLHLIFLTDEGSWREVEKTVIQAIGKHISESLLYKEKVRLKTLSMIFPQIQIEFVDLNSIVNPNREAIDAMKKLFCTNSEEEKVINETTVVVMSQKYREDLFYIAPFYPMTFKNLERLMVFDVDLLLKEDLGVLNGYFDDMTGEECIGLALDQTGYYREFKQAFIENDMVGLLGMDIDDIRLHGTNTGVVLYHLERIRQNSLLVEQTKTKSMQALADLLEFEGVVGDQEWYTLLLWKYPQLLKILPCEYNVQRTPLEFYPNPCGNKVKILHSHTSIHTDRRSFAHEFLREEE